uniref:Formin GTPase-binding domain-containing protein n=1 Tax=Romanomermis culicivorax TaxID=13658 RepID=A0A915JF80_ROMCU
MSSSSATCDGESGDEVPKMNNEQPPPKKVLVKGASTGWIKAKERWNKNLVSVYFVGFLKNLTSSGGDSASSLNSKSDIPPSPTLSASFFATLSPEMCVDLLRHSSPKIYKNIRRRISGADNDWMEAFFHANGLNVLFEMLAELTDSTKFCDSSSLNNVILPMYCVECVKSIMKNNHNMELIVGQPEYVYKLVQASWVFSETSSPKIMHVTKFRDMAHQFLDRSFFPPKRYETIKKKN